MKKFYVLLCIVIFTACSSEENIIYQGVDKTNFLSLAIITETAVSYEFCNGIVIDNCTVNLLNDDVTYAYGFDVTCSSPNTTYFNTADTVRSLFPDETKKDGLNTTVTRYNRFLSDDATYKFIQFSAISIPNNDNKIYISLNNMCYQWDFSLSPYKFIK